MTDNYFTLLDLPLMVDLDENLLRQNYFKLQQRYHPDTDPTQAAEMISKINTAYKILSSRQRRVEYILKLQGFDINDETNPFPPSPEMVEEILELREKIATSSIEEQEKMKLDLEKKQEDILNLIIKKIAESEYKIAFENLIIYRYNSKILEDIG